jgi:hypothetical protein
MPGLGPPVEYGTPTPSVTQMPRPIPVPPEGMFSDGFEQTTILRAGPDGSAAVLFVSVDAA